MTRRRQLVGLTALLFVLAGGGALAAALALGGAPAAAYRGSAPPTGVSLPSFELRDSGGELVRTSRLRGKVVLVTFLETECTEACPLIASHVGSALRLLAADQRADVVALGISTQPHDDTLARVRSFLTKHRAQALRYLVGSETQLRLVWEAFSILPALDTGDANTHSAPVRVFDRQGRWVTTLHAGADLTPENLRHDLALALAAS